jgi:MFS family permease
VLPPVLRYRDLRLFFTGAGLSYMGSQFTMVAMAWQIYQLTNSALEVGLIGLARAIPQISLSIFGGMLADALDRRRLLMAIQLGSCGVSASLAALSLAGLITPHLLLAGAVLFALGTSVETPTRQAVVPNLVETQHLSPALALNNIQRNLATILGPSLAGVLLAVAGPAECYLVDAASWFAMLVVLALIRRPLQGATRTKASLEALVAGAKFVRTQPVILSFMILDLGAMFFGSAVALLPIYARDILAVGPIGLGVLYAAPSIGALAAAAAMSTVVRVDNTGRWVLIGVAVYGACMVGFAISPLLWLSILMLAGTGAGNTTSAVLRGTSNQLLTPDHLRGRVTAVNSAFTTGGPQLGQFESGLVADIGGAPLSAITGGLATCLMVAAIALLPQVRRFRLSADAEPAVSLAEPAIGLAIR